ncbi:cupin domain-containing protein [Streptomyces tsukubensis]|uniref:LuxR family transcriptional regulator n=1 Tax=Streptomyces tsukubensis TaxID=83656 RepID=A0A1V4A7Q7_9ACTN|nr:cupin domain-containing protein [Streptomyces tsukubensis]OON78367.1 hypothetical protein B1H18_16355 [Streptomyces tsukubensis]QFR95127.1 LuxR family transcriptional regulator [Streptomyces tsukubensis]
MEPISLDTLIAELLEKAEGTNAARAARTLHGGSGHALRQTVIALLAGADLSDHEGPGEATVQVLRGQVRLTMPGEEGSAVDCAAGDLLVVPDAVHGFEAVTDAVVLLTVAMVEQPSSRAAEQSSNRVAR